MYETIPSEMKQYLNWICWKAIPQPRPDDPDHIGKLPINPKTGGNAQSNNPETWADFNSALKASEHYSGIGFMFGNSPFFGVDIDNVGDEIRDFISGENNIISEFVYALESYAELSPSKKGIHIICKGKLPRGARRKGKVEMYDSGRFFTVTGDSISDFSGISDCTETIKPLHEKYLGGSATEPVRRAVRQGEIPQTAAEIVELARKSKNGYKFQSLFAGNFSEYNSQSEADMALCNILAFWTGRNPELMDAIFRQSGLMREKWDRRQSGSTYGTLTIRRAIDECRQVYEPPTSFHVKIGREKKTPNLYTMDDMGNAKRFIDIFGEDFRYNYADKCFIYWDGRRWAADSNGAAERAADAAIEAMKQEADYYSGTEDDDLKKAFAKHIKSSRSNKSKNNLLKEIQHHIPIMPSQLDRHKLAFNVPNGTLSLKTGQLHDHNRKHFITKISPVEYTDKADCPMWQKFLDDIFAGDKELIRFVQKAVGYSMTGDTSEQCVFFLYGAGRNGKSTFLDVMREILGEYVSNIQPETIMVKNGSGSGINSDIARLKGARMVTSVEPNEGVRINEGLIKQLTGGDAVTARKLYGNEFEFIPEFKLWMATNHKPIIRGTDDGIWRRIHMLPFTVQIPPEKVDKHLKDKLRQEYPAILRWAVEGCILWQREGLKQPKSVVKIVQEYRHEMDVVSKFVDDRCEALANYSEKTSALYAAYCEWCDRNTEYKLSNTKFSSELGKRYDRVKKRDGSYFCGVRLYR